jgi:DNA mismatch endonuclease (patch repair protein)
MSLKKMSSLKKASVARSDIMRTVKSQNTAPERLVRSALHKRGFRFRLNVPNLPGKPDIVLSKHKIIIRVMGCFWHGHSCKRGNRMPKTNKEYWSVKIDKNKQRDIKQRLSLKREGWRVLDLWECKLKSSSYLNKIINSLILKTRQK